jgi:hypothetical protein
VHEKTGHITAHDTADDVEYLGPTWTRRDCYRRYCEEQGQHVMTSNIGTSTLEPIPSFDDPKPCIPWSTSMDVGSGSMPSYG